MTETVLVHPGNGTAYIAHGCRCTECIEANFARAASRRTSPKDPSDPRHGKASFYNNHGCRCDKCKAGWSAYLKKRAAAKAMEGAS